MDILNEPIKQFLDSLDEVLNNTNTLLFQYLINNEDLEEATSLFLQSNDFIEQFYKIDLDMNYHNFHDLEYNDRKEYFWKRRNIKLFKTNYQLKIMKPVIDKKEYLIAMHTGDTTKGKFNSFYGRNKNLEEAEKIVNDYIFAITDGMDWELFVIDPDFLEYDIEDPEDAEDTAERGYLIDECSSNNVLIIKCDKVCYMIMTNGGP